jgi:hypothetical protein
MEGKDSIEEDSHNSTNPGGLLSFFEDKRFSDKLSAWAINLGFVTFVFITLFISLLVVIQPAIMLTIDKNQDQLELQISELEGKTASSHEMLQTSLSTMKGQAESIAVLKMQNEKMQETIVISGKRETELVQINSDKTKRIEELEKEIGLLRERVLELESMIKQLIDERKKTTN